MNKISKEQVIASSRGWVASLLNFLPGLGTGYIYQRRWLPYFITTGAVTSWIIIGIILQGDKDPNQLDQLIGIIGLFLISIISSIEANLAFKKSVKIANTLIEEIKPPTKKGWFK